MELSKEVVNILKYNGVLTDNDLTDYLNIAFDKLKEAGWYFNMSSNDEGWMLNAFRNDPNTVTYNCVRLTPRALDCFISMVIEYGY